MKKGEARAGRRQERRAGWALGSRVWWQSGACGCVWVVSVDEQSEKWGGRGEREHVSKVVCVAADRVSWCCQVTQA